MNLNDKLIYTTNDDMQNSVDKVIGWKVWTLKVLTNQKYPGVLNQQVREPVFKTLGRVLAGFKISPYLEMKQWQ